MIKANAFCVLCYMFIYLANIFCNSITLKENVSIIVITSWKGYIVVSSRSWLKKVKLICSLVDYMAGASPEQACCPRMNNVPLSQTVYIIFVPYPGNMLVSNIIITNLAKNNQISKFWVQNNKIMTLMVNNGFVYHKPPRLWKLWIV